LFFFLFCAALFVLRTVFQNVKLAKVVVIVTSEAHCNIIL